MFSSILAGALIALGGYVNLRVGAPIGPILFSLALVSIVIFELNLFTGKAGRIYDGSLSLRKLTEIYCGNLFGVFICALGLYSLVPDSSIVCTKAAAIIEARESFSFAGNLAFGAICGLLMYIAVFGYQKTKNIWIVMFPVIFFVMGGFHHSIADMFYYLMGEENIMDLIPIIPTSLGNLIGAGIIPLAGYLDRKE